MAGHDILLITLGLTIAIGIAWRIRAVREMPFAANLADLVISLYLVICGALSIMHTFDHLQFLNNKIPATVLLFMPAALAAAGSKNPAKRKHTSATLWLTLGLAVSGYCVLANSQLGLPRPYAEPSALFAVLFLGSSTFFFKRYHRFLLGLCAIVWGIHVAQVNSMGSSGIGIVMGAISFSSIISFIALAGMNLFDFDLRDFIKSLANPCLILDMAGSTIYCNEHFLSLSGRKKEEVLGNDAIDMFDIPLDWRFRLGPAEKVKQVRCRLISADGERIPIRIILSEIRNAADELKNLHCEIIEEKERDLLESRLRVESLRFAGLYETSQALSSSLELKDVLKSIARAAESLTRSDSCTICTLDHSRRVLRPIYSSEEEYNAEIMNFEINVGSGLTGAVVADGKPRIQNFDDSSKVAVHIPGTSDEEEESLLSMPLVVKDAVIGALTLYKKGRRKFEPDDLKYLTVFASQAAAIIETSRLYMKLKASERLYRYSVNLAGDAILFIDFENGKITDANESALKLFKYSRAEFLGQRIWELNPEHQMQVAKRLWTEARQTGWGSLGEVEYVGKDGSVFPASVNVSVIYTGDTNSIQWMVRDLSEFKRAIEKVGFFHQLVERLDEPVLLTNTQGKAAYSNAAFRSVFGLSAEEAATCDIASINLQGSRLDVLMACWSRLRGKDILIDEIIVESDRKVSEKKTVSVLPCRNAKGDLKYFIWLFHPPIGSVPAENPRAAAALPAAG